MFAMPVVPPSLDAGVEHHVRRRAVTLDVEPIDDRVVRVAEREGHRAAVEDLGLPENTFKVAIDGDLPPVRADAAQLERAFANLLDNAYRHSGGHPVSVSFRAP